MGANNTKRITIDEILENDQYRDKELSNFEKLPQKAIFRILDTIALIEIEQLSLLNSNIYEITSEWLSLLTNIIIANLPDHSTNYNNNYKRIMAFLKRCGPKLESAL